ncbi:MAG: glycosyltransferase [Flavobacteriales bacterium]
MLPFVNMSERKRILVLTPWSYKDGLIQAYTLPYVKIISELPFVESLWLVTDEQDSLKLTSEESRAAKDRLQELKVQWLPKSYVPFGIEAVVAKVRQLLGLIVLIRKEKVTHIHAWTTPGGVLGYCLSVISRKPLVIDSFEPHAEAQVENGTWRRSSLGFRLLWWFEKRMARHAQALIYTSKNMVQYARDKYDAYDEKELVKPACVDLEKFASAPRKDGELLQKLGLVDMVVGVYAGKLGGIYHDVELFEFAARANTFWNGRFRLLMLTTEPRDSILEFARQANCPNEIIVSLFVDHDEIPRHMKLADFGITLVKSVPTKKCCTPIKDGEYWASGLPIVITENIGDDSEIVKDQKTGFILKDFDRESMERCFNEAEHLIANEEIHDRCELVAMKYRPFEIANHVYNAIYKSL